MVNLIINKKTKKRRHSYLLKTTAIAMIISLLFLAAPMNNGVGPLWNGNIATASSFAGGTGTETDPYLISTAVQLTDFSTQVNGGTSYAGNYIKMTNDIIAPAGFISIGNSNNPFKGNFNGAGYEIIGLYINKGSVNYQGLFGYADTGSVIKDVNISGSVGGADQTGAVAGYTNGLITRCTVNCPVTVNWKSDHGGIAGYGGADSVISDCTVLSNVEGTNCVGGIVGYTEGKVIDCNSNGALSGFSKVGGIAGYAAGTSSEIRNCTFSGSVTANSAPVGGIVGQTDGLIAGCTMDGSVQGNSGTIGGIAGYAAGSASLISDCTVSGSVKAAGGYGYVGGVAGKTDGKITGCVAECSVEASGQHYVGGVAGSASTGSEISNSSSSGDISGTGKVGGIAGYTDGEISICINTGNVNGGGSGHAGGVAGEAGNNGTVSNSFNSGSVSGGGQGNVGGIVGYASSDTVVHHNLNKGEVEGNKPVGSVIGNSVDPDNVWNNYYYDYPDAPGGTNNNDIETDDGAVPVGDLTWEEIQKLLNDEDEEGEGTGIWNQDLDDDGIPKPGEGSSPSSPAVIKAGKCYARADLGNSTTAQVTKDSVFTVAFSLKYESDYNASALQGQIVKFTPDEVDGDLRKLPAGTAIIMRAEKSYYYFNLPQSTDKITLGDFIKMGSIDNNDCFNPPAVTSGQTREYLFIFDLTKNAAQISAGSYYIELTFPSEDYSGTKPKIEITEKGDYELIGFDNGLQIKLVEPPFSGYDHKTHENTLVYEFCLKEEGGNNVSFPVGTKLNDTYISADLPYAFLPVDQDLETEISLDMSACDSPLDGDYDVTVTVYASTDPLNPRGGYILVVDSSTTIKITASVYAIKAEVDGERVFDRSAGSINVAFKIETSVEGTVKATLQKKYGKSYIDLEGPQPLMVNNDQKATYNIPENTGKGTYRFLITLHDENDAIRAQSIQNIIIK